MTGIESDARGFLHNKRVVVIEALVPFGQARPFFKESAIAHGRCGIRPDRLRLRFSDESLPSRPWKLDFLRRRPEQKSKLALDYQRPGELSWQYTYWDRFHRSCTTKMKVSQKLCFAVRNLRRIHPLACH